MDELLRPVKVTATKKEHGEFLTEIRPTRVLPTTSTAILDSTNAVRVSSPEDALENLRSQPSASSVASIIAFLAASEDNRAGFCIFEPGPLAAQLVHTLVNVTIPDYWRSFKGADERVLRDLVRCLRSVAGIGAITARIRALTAETEKSNVPKADGALDYLEDMLNVLTRVLEGETFCVQLWKRTSKTLTNSTKRTLVWNELVSQLGSGKLVSIAAQAAEVLAKVDTTLANGLWVTSGAEFATWLGQNIALMIRSEDGTEDSGEQSAAARLCGKALGLGYRSQLIEEVLQSSVIEMRDARFLAAWLSIMLANERRQFIEVLLRHYLPKHLSVALNAEGRIELVESRPVQGSAALLKDLASKDPIVLDTLQSAISTTAGPSSDGNLAVIRAVLSALSQFDDKLHDLLETCMATFGDSLYIKHTPEQQQEVLAQILLICSGYIHRRQPMALFMLARSSSHMNGISARLRASSPRARFLGMTVGVTISELVDKPDSRMKFEFDDSDAAEVLWFKQLPQVDDPVGEIGDLITTSQVTKSNQTKSAGKTKPSKKEIPPLPAASELKGPRIVEILDDSEDDDLVPYDKPDSDPEDEDDDPSSVRRNKPIAPVYIRDLIASLKDHENYDRHTLALKTAPSLIRRKANFGKEVTNHIDDIAEIVISLQDHFELDEFAVLRQQALIAILIASPAHVGQYYARAYFDGEYSIAQRIAILTAIGLGTRELAGFTDFDSDHSVQAASSAFPSKTLPPHLHAIYASSSDKKVLPSPIASISHTLEQTIMQPLAAEAADKATGPNILKIRTFSSRMAVEAKRKKPIANSLAKIVAQHFFFPLTGQWWSHLQSYGPSTAHAGAHLLPMFLRTLALLLHSSGPSTLSLPSLTAEFFDLLLSLRTRALEDRTILSAWLFAMLMLLEVNEDGRRLATEHAKELLEMQMWVKGVFEGLSGGREGSEDERVRMLAAGVLVRNGEVVEKWQRVLMGDMMNYER